MTYVFLGAAAGDQAGAGPRGLASPGRLAVGAPGGSNDRGYVYAIDRNEFREADLSDGILDGRISLTAFPEDPDESPHWVEAMYLGAAEGDGIGTFFDVYNTQGVPLADPDGRDGAGSAYSDVHPFGDLDLADVPAAGGPTYRFDGADAGDAAGTDITPVTLTVQVTIPDYILDQEISGVVIGAPGADGLGRVDAGTAYLIDEGVYSFLDGRDGATDGVIDLVYAETPHDPAYGDYYTFIGEAAGDGAGSTVGPSRNYLTIAAQGADGSAPGGSDAGAVYLIHEDDVRSFDVLSDGTNDAIIDLTIMAGDSPRPDWHDWQSYKLLGEAGGDRLGAVLQQIVVTSTDFGSDTGSIHLRDVVTSTDAGSDAGSVYLLDFGELAGADAADGATDGVIGIASMAGRGGSYQFNGAAAGDAAGAAVSGTTVSDTWGPSLVIGAPGADIVDGDGNQRIDAGAVYLINENDYAAADAADGTADGVIDLANVPDLARSYMFYGAAAGDAAGSTVAGAFIGAPGSDLAGSDAGAIYTYSADELSRLDALDGTVDHRIDLGDFSSTDHVVEGTEGDDYLERYTYLNDPNLDMVDDGDAADGSDDDVIRALGGDDWITSSAGSDSIDGGEGTDTYVARSLNIYSFRGVGSTTATDMTGVGDFDGDGLDDILISDVGAGSAYLIAGSNLNPPSDIIINGIVDLVALSGRPGNHHLTNLSLGGVDNRTMSSLGDIDGDEKDDFAVWPMPGEFFWGSSEPGPATILTSSFLAGAPNEIDMSGVAGQPGVISFTGGAGYTGGYAMSDIGDAVGDASVDVLIALTDADVGGVTNAGIVYLIDGDQLDILAGSDGVIDLSAIEGRAGVTTFLGTNDGSREVHPGDDISSASSVIGLSSGGDVDGDGKSDILIGMPFHDAIPQPLGPKSAGEAYLVTSTALGTAAGATAGGITIDLGNMPSADGYVTFTAPEPVAGTGWDVSLASDIDGDGFDDILIGTPDLYFFGDGSPASGGVYLVTSAHLQQGTGTDPATIPAQTVDLATIAGQDGSLALLGREQTTFWGESIAPLGDLDGDGRDDIVIGGRGYRSNWSLNDTGQIYVLYGADLTETNLPDGTYELHTNQASPVLIGPDNRSYYFDGWRNNTKLGAVLTSAGDVDGDGRDDILVGDEFGSNPYLVHAADLVELDATTNDNETSPNPPPVRDFRGTIAPPIPQSETLDVTILSATDGSATATVHKVDLGATDGVTSIEAFRAGEGLAEADRIDFTALGGLRSGQIGLSEADREAAVGTFTPLGGAAIAFGPAEAVTLADILADPATYGEGRFVITDGTESGTLDGVAFQNFETIEFDGGIICFAADVAIAVPGGTVPAGKLAVGDRVLTADRGPQPIRWIGRQVLGAAELAARPNLRPIRICAGALGEGLPRRAMLVSPQHRMLIAAEAAKRAFGAAEVLVPAKALLGLPGVAVAEDLDGIRYVHFLCDRHEVVFAEGAPSESLLPGPQALRSLAPASRAEVLALFPELARSGPGQPARPLIRQRHAARRLGPHLQQRPGRQPAIGSAVQGAYTGHPESKFGSLFLGKSA